MTPDLAAAYGACEQQLRAEDHDAWLATLFAPAPTRPHLQALGAFTLEVGHARTRVRQPIAGEIRLQWWQDVIDGERTSEASAHPVATAIVDTLARCRLPRALFGDVLDAQRLTLYDEPPPDVPTLERRLVALHGTPIRLAADILGGRGEAIVGAAADAGSAIGIAALLADAAQGGEGHRALLPSDLLARRGVGRESIGNAAALSFVLDDLRAIGQGRLASLRRRRGTLGDAAAAFLIAALAAPRLAAPGRDLPPWRRQWRLWRAARRGGVL